MKTDVFGYVYLTNCLGFLAEKPIFAVSRDGTDYCKTIGNLIDDYEEVRTIQVHQKLILFSPVDEGVKVTLLENLLGSKKIIKKQLEPLGGGFRRLVFALALVNEQLVVLSGGSKVLCSENSEYCSSVRALNLSRGKWLSENTIPDMNDIRFNHSSC